MIHSNREFFFPFLIRSRDNTNNISLTFFMKIQVSQTTSKLNIDDYDVDEDESDVENIQSNKNGETNDDLEERYNK